MDETAKFNMIDENFICDVCGFDVKALGYSARDHCPNCLSGKHLDINPGDRACLCHGSLVPIAIEPGKKEDYKIVYVCRICKELKRNKTARDDNMDLIIKIMSNPKTLDDIKREWKKIESNQ